MTLLNKLYYFISGFEIMATLLFVMVHHAPAAIFTFAMAYMTWTLGDSRLEMEKKND